MSDVRNKPCMSHYPDFDHHCASKGQGCEYYMKTFKVYTKWTGCSEYIVNAKNEQEAKDSIEEELKFDGLAEEILKVKEVS